MNISSEQLKAELLNSRALAELTNQGGWVETDSLTFRVVAETGAQLIVAVNFTEVIMEASGCCADRRAGFGYLQVELDGSGQPMIIRTT